MSLQNPLETNLLKLPVNTTMHGRSTYRPQDVRGHNVVTGWFLKMTRDAIDWFIAAGWKVRACHLGKVIDIRDRNGRLACVIIQGHQDGHLYKSVYAHLHVRECINVGDIISMGTLIGWVGRKLKRPHLHFELWVDGQGVTYQNIKGLCAKFAKMLTG